MTKLQFLNVFLTERLMFAAQEIYKAVEDTILEYQEEISRRERESDHLRRRLREAGIQMWTDPQTVAPTVSDDEAPADPLEWSPSEEQEDQEATRVKEELKFRTSQIEEDLQGLESDTSESIFTPPCVNSDYDQDSPQASHLYPTQSVENRERDSLPSTTFKLIKAESDRLGYSTSEAASEPQPSCAVNPDCREAESEHSVSISVVESGGLLAGFEGTGSAVRGQPSHEYSRGEKTIELSHRKSPQEIHGTSIYCKVCGKSFRHTGHLNMHVRVHSKEKPYCCGVCGKCFSSSGRLKEHQRIHTGEKPYRCHVCGKCFNQTAHLKVHLRVHTGEKPYSCPVCGKCFSQSNKIKRHLQTHNRERAYFSGQ